MANKSACAVDFKTGSMSDPASKLGLSHLLEHVVSSRFSDGCIGMFNASTSPEHTNFRFDTDHKSFAKALKVFAKVLNSPSLERSRIEAEKRVINSEFEQNRYDQTVLRSHIFNMTNDPKHPLSGFHHGNMRTLKDISSKDLDEFINSNYFASNSKVAIVSALPYEEIDMIVREAFRDFRPAKQTGIRSFSKIFTGMELPQKVCAKLDDSMLLCFELGSTYEQYRTKPHWILNYLLNTKRSGSLLRSLKEKGLATDVLASVQPFSFSSLLFIELRPTKKGLEAPELIVGELFSYLEFIKDTGYPEYIFNEQKRICEAGFRFHEQNEGMVIVKDLARLMHYYPAADAERFNSLIFDHGIEELNSILGLLKLDNMKILICNDQLNPKKQEPYYDVAYDVEKIKDVEIVKGTYFKYPEENRFVMDNPMIHEDDKKHTLPYRLINDKRGTAWFQQDSVLKLPMLYFNLLILTPVVNKDPFSKLLSIFYTRIVSEMLEETLDEAGEAGLSFGLDRDDRGISLFFSGYSQKMPLLFNNVLSTLKLHGLDDKMLQSVKEILRNDYLALENGSSFSLAQYFKYQLIHKNSIPYTEYMDLLDKVTIADINNFSKSIYDNISLESHIYGNISPSRVGELYNTVFNELSARCLNKKDIPRDAVMDYGEGNSYAYVVNTNSLDHCWSSFYQFGERTIRLSAIIQLGHMFLAPFFFGEIRGKKQLGYVAETRVEFFEKVLGLSFVILSDDNSSDTLAKEAESTLKDFLHYLENLPIDVFENNKRVLTERVNKNNRTLEDWMNDIFLTSIFKGDTDYAKKLSKEVAALSLKEVVQAFENALLGHKRASVSVYAGPYNLKPSKGETYINDIRVFKSKARTFLLDK